jgi:hypothetical protein
VDGSHGSGAAEMAVYDMTGRARQVIDSASVGGGSPWTSSRQALGQLLAASMHARLRSGRKRHSGTFQARVANPCSSLSSGQLGRSLYCMSATLHAHRNPERMPRNTGDAASGHWLGTHSSPSRRATRGRSRASDWRRPQSACESPAPAPSPGRRACGPKAGTIHCSRGSRGMSTGPSLCGSIAHQMTCASTSGGSTHLRGPGIHACQE